MSLTSIETTWGPPLVASYRSRKARVRTPRIEDELYTFLSSEISTWRPELIVGVERRGTAILRALKETKELDCPWSKVVSSRVLRQLPLEDYQGKAILIFDDMKTGGTHINTVLDDLLDFDPTGAILKNVHVAVFAIHEKAATQSPYAQYGVTDTWFYRGLTTPAYRNKRLAIVSMLQRAGSLMLDTEHIEVRVRLKGAFPDFMAALGRNAHVVTFRSGGGRRNVTVFYDDPDPAHEIDILPKGATTCGIVKKCRVVERQGDEFAVIPICYPNVPDDPSAWHHADFYAALLGNPVQQCGCARFYGTALLSALSVLSWVLKGLYAAGPHLATVYLPGAVSDELHGNGFTLEHLRVIYPTLGVSRLADTIAAIDAEASRGGTELRRHALGPRTQIEASDSDLRKDARKLLQVIRHALDNCIQEEKLFDSNWRKPHPFGLTADNILRFGDCFGWHRARTSALFDILIDDCHLVTDATDTVDDDGVRRWKRVFEVDGEMVSELVRLYTIQRGLPNGF